MLKHIRTPKGEKTRALKNKNKSCLASGKQILFLGKSATQLQFSIASSIWEEFGKPPAWAQIHRHPTAGLPSQAALISRRPRANDGVEAQELSLWEPRGPFSGSSPARHHGATLATWGTICII
jgi:hypothetical protein